MKRLTILILLIASVMWAQPLTFKIAKPIRNFVQFPATSLVNEPNCVFAMNGTKQGSVVVDISGNLKNGTISKVISAGGVEGGLSLVSTQPSLITIGNIGNIKTLALRLKLNSTTEKIIEGIDNGSLVYSSSGTLTQPFTTAYINGVAGSTVPSGQIFTLVLVGTSAIDFSNFKIGVNNTTYGSLTIYDARAYSTQWTTSQVTAYHNQFARQPYIVEDFSQYSVGSFPNNEVKVSGTFAIAQVSVAEGKLLKNDKYLNCSSAGSFYISASGNISNYYISYEFYTGGSWTTKSGVVSTVSTAEASFDYSTSTNRLTFILATNERIAKIKITKGQTL